MPWNSGALHSEKGSLVPRTAGTAREVFSIPVCWTVQLLMPSLALLTALESIAG